MATTSEPFYSEDLIAVPCPANSAGTVPGSTGTDSSSGCTTNPGYSGAVTATITDPFYTSSLQANDCTSFVPIGLGLGSACDALVTDATCLHQCINGYHDNNAEQGQSYTCPTGQLTGTPLECTPAICADLTVTNSSALPASGVTLDEVVVVCDTLFWSVDGVNFTLSCDGVDLGASAWSNVQRCLSAFEIKIVMDNSTFDEATVQATFSPFIAEYFSGTAEDTLSTSLVTVTSESSSYDVMTVKAWLLYEDSMYRDGNYSYARGNTWKNTIRDAIAALDSELGYTMTVSKLNEPRLSGAALLTLPMISRGLLFCLAYALWFN